MAKGVRLRGTNANDLFEGTRGNDVYFGEGGNDTLLGFAGNDNCNGGRGNDRVDGGDGDDTVNGEAGNDNLFGGRGDDTITGGAGNDRINAGRGDDTAEGGSGSDRIDGGDGNDNLDGGSGNDLVLGGNGNDLVAGGSGNDALNGGAGNDIIDGGKGDDRMNGAAGNDILGWRDGEGSDIMIGGDGLDTVAVEGSLTGGDNFILGKNAEGKALFDRPTVDGQPNGAFTLTIESSEVIAVNGEGGNDTFVINDLIDTGVNTILFSGGEGNDIVDARNTSTVLTLEGGNGDDVLTGGTGTRQVQFGTATVTLGDSLTGGGGRDKFQFVNDPFTGVAVGNSNRPDEVLDYEIGQDQIVFGRSAFGLNNLNFQSANANQLSGNSNLVVLTDAGFANAGQAAAAIANNNNFNGGRGAFVYYNTTLGFSRVVFSEDLANNGRFSVQSNLTNLTSSALQANFTAADFGLV
ncbi:MAG: calcium-binding protein [Leptolyngbyaceae cyanobacterium SL_7_1]|nr:calcium-binding protein [Leptolyngbyaceae cyanobacterium SL_7_1]